MRNQLRISEADRDRMRACASRVRRILFLGLLATTLFFALVAVYQYFVLRSHTISGTPIALANIAKNVKNAEYQSKEEVGPYDIPLIVYQTYNMKELIPSKVADNFKKYAPQYERYVFNDSESAAYIQKHFDEAVYRTFFQLKGAHRADLFRYAILYMNGGVYIDIKTELLVPLLALFPKSSADYGVGPITYTVLSGGPFKRSLFQGVIATPRRNPLFLKLIQDFVQSKKPIPEYPRSVKLMYELIADETSHEWLQGGLNSRGDGARGGIGTRSGESSSEAYGGSGNTTTTSSSSSSSSHNRGVGSSSGGGGGGINSSRTSSGNGGGHSSHGHSHSLTDPSVGRGGRGGGGGPSEGAGVGVGGASGELRTNTSGGSSLRVAGGGDREADREGSAAFSYFLFEERRCPVSECYDGADKLNSCYFIFRGSDRVLKTRYAEYPWHTTQHVPRGPRLPVLIDFNKYYEKIIN